MARITRIRTHEKNTTLQILTQRRQGAKEKPASTMGPSPLGFALLARTLRLPLGKDIVRIAVVTLRGDKPLLHRSAAPRLRRRHIKERFFSNGVLQRPSLCCISIAGVFWRRKFLFFNGLRRLVAIGRGHHLWGIGIATLLGIESVLGASVQDSWVWAKLHQAEVPGKYGLGELVIKLSIFQFHHPACLSVGSWPFE